MRCIVYMHTQRVTDLLDLDLLPGREPLVALSTGELVHAVVASHQRRRPRAVEHNNRGHLHVCVRVCVCVCARESARVHVCAPTFIHP